MNRNGATPTPVSREQRFTRQHPCPVCEGRDSDRRGTGDRDYGFLSSDGLYAHCTREEFAGDLPLEENSNTYAHRLVGDCRCGMRHDTQEEPEGQIIATYPYADELGTLLFEVVRFEPKGFRQRRPDSGGWVWNIQGVRRVPYRLPELLAADPTAIVFIVEGEKDVDNLHALGLVATTSAMGAKNWQPEYAAYLRGRDVALIPDNDDDGRAYVEKAAQSLLTVAASVRIVALPELGNAGDVSDWIKSGGTADQLTALVAITEPRSAAERTHSMVLSEFLTQSVTRTPDRVAPLIAAGITALHGGVGVGKTLGACEIAATAATGISRIGLIAEPMHVLYVQADMPASGFRDYLRDVLGDRVNAAGDRLHIWIPEGLRIDTTEGAAALMAEVRTTGAQLLILDYFDALISTDGFLPSAVRPALDCLKAIRDGGCAVLWLDQERKQANNQKGAQAPEIDNLMGSRMKSAALDRAWSVRLSGAKFTLTPTKSRGVVLEPVTMTFDAHGFSLLTAAWKETPSLAACRDFIKKAKRPVTRVQIMSKTELSDRTVKSNLAVLISLNLVREAGVEGKAKVYTWNS